MSVTTTANPVTGSVLSVLAEYDLHHSGQAEASLPAAPNPRPEPTVRNPDWWPTDQYRVPDFRPVNTNLDLEERPDGINAIERLFIFTMLNGVGLMAVFLQMNLVSLWLTVLRAQHRRGGGREDVLLVTHISELLSVGRDDRLGGV